MKTTEKSDNAKEISLRIQRALKEIKFKEEFGFELKLAEAAPELLEALNGLYQYKKILNDFLTSNSADGTIKNVFKQAEEAIKKATDGN